MINFVQDIIDFLVEQTVGAIKFLFYVWDDLVKPALGSAITLIKEVAKFTITLILSIMTKALTTDNPYKNYTKQKFQNTMENTGWSAAINNLTINFNNIDIKNIIKPFSDGVASGLGSSDSFFQMLTSYQQFFNLPGIIRDLMNLVGPNLAITLFSELLRDSITIIFQTIIESWDTNEIIDFLQINLITQWLENNITSIISPEINPDLFDGWDCIKTFSELIFKILTILLNVKIVEIMECVKMISNIFLQSSNLITNAFIDIISIMILQIF